MKRIILIVGLITALIGLANAQSTTDFKEITGKVIDLDTQKPLPQSNVYIKDAEIGTVANNSGEFLLKVPVKYSNGKIVASSIGYTTFEKDISGVTDGVLVIQLKPVPIMMSELIIQDADAILNEALIRKSKNYPDDYQLMTSFYREIVKKNRSYIDVSQGILNVSKASYTGSNRDELSIVKGNRSQQYEKEDTLAFKIMGGPNTMLLLDIVKNPGIVLNRETFEFYNYNLDGIEMFDGKQNYAISFAPKASYNTPLYSGIIYVDVNSYAISGLSFGYDQENMKKAASQLVKRKPAFAKLTPLKVQYEVKYRETNGVWYLDYVRNELEMRCNWKKRLFNSTFNSVSEMVVTDKNIAGGNEEFTRRNTTKSTDIFSEKVGNFSDANFWENYSIIQPEDDLRKALAKIDRKKN